MSKALRFTKAELANAAKVCREQNVVVKIARDGSMIFFPAAGLLPKLDASLEDELDAELAAFEAALERSQGTRG